ncbi:PARP-type domain-containing protein [Durusdinium trenchii]|uniref:PARP-type domain-containing protein n=1 Tax=Durusdinium trenchii TaxID=1381693 RepID=A0ABP0P7V3_9DINO
MAEKERIKKMPVKELKAYLDRHNTSHADLFEKAENTGDNCRLCGKQQQE